MNQSEPCWVHLVLGSAAHGVTRHALELATAAGEPICHLDGGRPPTLDQVLRALAPALARGSAGLVHLHVTDRLCGNDPTAAADLVTALAGTVSLSITLHDLPQPSDGAMFDRRTAAYRRMAEAAVAVQVSSHHEHDLLARTAPGVTAMVVPLPIPTRMTPTRIAAARLAQTSRSRRVPPTVGVLGYLYPGKGHAQVLEALDRLGRNDVELVALGGPSAGHDWLIDDLRRQAGRRRVEVTGYLADEELDRRILEVTVPVVAPEHVSASASLHRWLGCGRRPVATLNGYSREIEQAHPGALLLTQDLPRAIADALDQPQSTWRDPVTVRPGTAPTGTAPTGTAGAAALQTRILQAVAQSTVTESTAARHKATVPATTVLP